MATQVTNYQCPACTGPLHYLGESGMLECDYCGSKYTAAEIEALYAEKEKAASEAKPADSGCSEARPGAVRQKKIACCQKWSHCLPGSSLWILLAPRCCAHNSRIIHIALPAPAVLCISESYYSFW